MEKLKWILLALLLIVLAVVIFYTPRKQMSDDKENTAVIRIEHRDKNEDINPSVKIEKGEYVLHLDEFQVIEGKGSGLYLRFSMPLNEKELIMTFNVVDTSGSIFTDTYPVQISQSVSETEPAEGKTKLYRGLFKTGFYYQITKTQSREDIIPMPEFSCRIDTLWHSDSLGGIKMEFSATHSDFLAQVYGLRYVMTGKAEIHNARFVRRIIQ